MRRVSLQWRRHSIFSGRPEKPLKTAARAAFFSGGGGATAEKKLSQ